MMPSPFQTDGFGAVWVAYGAMGYWSAWYIKQNTVFYLPTCFDTESTAVAAAQAQHGNASH
jgi:hypothetical protein